MVGAVVLLREVVVKDRLVEELASVELIVVTAFYYRKACCCCYCSYVVGKMDDQFPLLQKQARAYCL